MRKLLNQPWFVGLLAIGAFVFVGVSLMPKKTTGIPTVSTDPTVEEQSTDEAQASAGSSTGLNGKNLQAPEITSAMRDPFTASARSSPVQIAEAKAEPDQVETFHLSAIWSQGATTYVLLNGHILQSGDTIGRIKIETASLEGVWLAHWKGRDHLALGQDFTLTTPTKKLLQAVSSI